MEEKITFIIPTLNEKAIMEILDTLISNIKEYSYEVLLVDDSAQDKFDLLKQEIDAENNERIKLLRGDRVGKGAAIRKGILVAEGSIIFYLDADLRIPLKNIPLFIRLINEQGYDVVVAERPFNKTPRTLTRLFCSLSLFLIVRILIFQSAFFFDTQCGFKAFRKEILKKIAERQSVKGGMFDIEYLYIARFNKLKINRMRVFPLPEIRTSKINLLRCLLCDLFDLLRIKIRGIFGVYDFNGNLK